jgi:hypothetical protein
MPRKKPPPQTNGGDSPAPLPRRGRLDGGGEVAVTQPEDQSRVAEICRQMDRDKLSEFNEFIKDNPSYNDIRQWLIDHTGEDVAIAHIAGWYKATFPEGEEAKVINSLLGAYHGLEVHRVAHMALGVSIKFLIKIQEHFIDNEVAFAKLSVVQAVNMVPGLLREIRSLVQQIEQQGMAYDAMQQELGGAAFAVQELLIVHKDTPLEAPIKAMAPEIFKKIRAKYIGTSAGG